MLGSTGSVGTQTLVVARALSGLIEVVALAAGRNSSLLSQQLAEFRPRRFHSADPASVLPSGAVYSSLDDIAADERVDTVVVATSGRAGLSPTLTALRHGKRVALASKEVLVMAGAMVMEAARTPGASLIPVDSEHSAIHQCLKGEAGGVERILLTASGGPFLDLDDEALHHVTARDALAHPVWSMGAKITIDSATLMNKGLEVVEAHHLFGVPFEHIEVLIHPECVVHSMVEFVDGSVKAQLSSPDMVLPLQCALTDPERVRGVTPALRWDTLRTLTFRPVDTERFPCLPFAAEACTAGSTYPAVLCGADEAAVNLFLRGEIRFTDIALLVRSALAAHNSEGEPTLDSITHAYDWAASYVLARRTGASPTAQ